MKRFETGKTYSVQGGGLVTVTGRTKNFVTFSGDFSGRKKYMRRLIMVCSVSVSI
jgi:hypothetical protein